MSVDFPKSSGFRTRTKDFPWARSSWDLRSLSKDQWNRNMKLNMGRQQSGCRRKHRREDRIHDFKDVPFLHITSKRTSISGVFARPRTFQGLDSHKRLRKRTSFKGWREIKTPTTSSPDPPSVAPRLSRGKLTLAITIFAILGKLHTNDKYLDSE